LPADFFDGKFYISWNRSSVGEKKAQYPPGNGSEPPQKMFRRVRQVQNVWRSAKNTRVPPMKAVLDAGPLIVSWNADDKHHAWADNIFKE
jgi:hypothetical protein